MYLTAIPKLIHSSNLWNFVQKVNVLKKSWTIHPCYNPRTLKNGSNSIHKKLKLTRTNKINIFWTIRRGNGILTIHTTSLYHNTSKCIDKTHFLESNRSFSWAENKASSHSARQSCDLGHSRSCNWPRWQMSV